MKVKAFVSFGEEVLALSYRKIGMYAGYEEYEKLNSGEYSDSDLEEDEYGAIRLKRPSSLSEEEEEEFRGRWFYWDKYSPIEFFGLYMSGIVSEDVLVEFETTNDISLKASIVPYADYHLITEYSCPEYDKHKLVPKRCIYGVNLFGENTWEEYQEFSTLEELQQKISCEKSETKLELLENEQQCLISVLSDKTREFNEGENYRKGNDTYEKTE